MQFDLENDFYFSKRAKNFVLGCIIRKSLCFSVGEQTSSSKLLLSINSWSVWLSREKIRLGLRFKTHYICEKSCRKRTPEFIHITTKTNQGNNITCYTSFIIQLSTLHFYHKKYEFIWTLWLCHRKCRRQKKGVG